MYLEQAANSHKLLDIVLKACVLLSVVLYTCLQLSQIVSAQAAPVSYVATPATGSVRPNETFELTLTFQTSTTIAGGSVHLDFASSSYAGFQSSNSSSLSFVDYHPEQNDVVFICNNNNCPPGSYAIAVISVRAAGSGTAHVTFVPRETADPSLNLIAASGASSSFTITQTAAASKSTSRPRQNTYTIPQDDGSGGIIPLPVTNEQYIDRQNQADNTIQKAAKVSAGQSSFWSVRNIVLIGLAIGVGLGFMLFIVWRMLGGSSRPRGPGPYGPTDAGPTLYSR